MNKICTDLEQSKKLVELGIDVKTADMFWDMAEPEKRRKPLVGPISDYYDMENWAVPAWSLSALMNLLDDKAGLAKDYGLWFCYDNGKSHCTKHYDEPIDAAYKMIIHLHELKML